MEYLFRAVSRELMFIGENNFSPRKYSFLEEKIIRPNAVSNQHFCHGGVQTHEEEQPAALYLFR
jgi:hypothetical protein